jgi:ubiquinone/menaquinone biosynthesis C-methylase UbiE
MRPGIAGEQAIKEEYAHLAPTYDEHWSFYVHATLSETAKRLALRESDRVLDVGCGTAALFEIISPKYPTVQMLGADLSPEMLGVARKKLRGRASFLSARASELPFRSSSFDILVSCNAFHFFRDPEECLSEFARVLRPAGRLVITDWCDDFISCRVCDFFLCYTNRAHYRMYGRSELERLIRSSGFQNVQAESYKINWLWGLMTVHARK